VRVPQNFSTDLSVHPFGSFFHFLATLLEEGCSFLAATRDGDGVMDFMLLSSGSYRAARIGTLPGHS
jgi:hypothetical protein